jgi:multiple sugar transport system ATP-binding protein
MTVFGNMAFPLRMRRFAKQEIANRVREAAALLGLEALLERRPNQLSGGQRQRVAMGRAIVRRPAAFLMDEPLSNLDAKLRTQMRAELARLHQRLGVTTLYVTHDQTEAMTLGSRIAVMRDGVVQQSGTPQELYRRPRNSFVARFIGSPPMNLMHGELADGVLTLDAGDAAVQVRLPDAPAAGRLSVIAGVRPEAWRTSADAGAGATLSLAGEVAVVEDLGAETLVYFDHGVRIPGLAQADGRPGERTFTARLPAGVALAPGERVTFHADASALHLFAADTGEALALAPVAA